MKKVNILLLTVFACVSPCFGLTRQEKDRLVNSALAQFMDGKELAVEQSQALEMDELAFLMFSDALADRVTSKKPKQNDLIDKYLSQCDETVLRRIAFLETHPKEMCRFWRECWQKASEKDRQEIMKDSATYIQAARQKIKAFGKLDQLLALSDCWNKSGGSEKALENDPVLAPLAQFAHASDTLEAFIDFADEDILEKYFYAAQDVSTQDASPSVQKQKNSEWKTLMVVADYLMGKTSMQALEQVLKDVSSEVHARNN